MKKGTRPPGKTTVAPEVLLNIASLTTLGVEGVSRLSSIAGGMNRFLQKGHYSDGVRIMIEDKKVSADIHVILKKDINIREVSRNVQKEVSRAISEMVGMEAGNINVHIEDIDY